MEKLENHGTISLTGSKIATRTFIVPTSICTLELVKITNPTLLACTITLSKYDRVNRKLITLYTLTLDDGDTVFDTFPYILNDDEYLHATSTIAGITFLTQSTVQE